MKSLGWILAIIGAVILGGSLFVETRLAPLIGAVLLSGGILYATLQNAQAGRSNLLKAERAARRRKKSQATSTSA